MWRFSSSPLGMDLKPARGPGPAPACGGFREGDDLSRAQKHPASQQISESRLI
jgi:hypothetical protein